MKQAEIQSLGWVLTFQLCSNCPRSHIFGFQFMLSFLFSVQLSCWLKIRFRLNRIPISLILGCSSTTKTVLSYILNKCDWGDNDSNHDYNHQFTPPKSYLEIDVHWVTWRETYPAGTPVKVYRLVWQEKFIFETFIFETFIFETYLRCQRTNWSTL